MKTFVRIDLDARTLDEIDRRAIAANMSRSDYVAMLVEKFPLIRDALVGMLALAESLGAARIDAHELRSIYALLASCQTTEVVSPGGSGDLQGT